MQLHGAMVRVPIIYLNDGGFLQTSHLPKPEHGPFSSLKWYSKVLGKIIR
jgi:hypothetical protein